MQILSTSPLVSIVSRWNLSSDHRHNGHKLNFPIEKRVVIYYTCCLSFSHFQLYAIEFILLYFTQHLITLLLSAFQQHNMWGVAFLFLFKAFFFVCCCCLYFCSSGHEEGCILTQSSLPGFLFSPISHRRGAEIRRCSTSPRLPMAVQHLLQIIPHQRWHITDCLCVCCHAMLHTWKRLQKTPQSVHVQKGHPHKNSVCLTDWVQLFPPACVWSRQNPPLTCEPNLRGACHPRQLCSEKCRWRI